MSKPRIPTRRTNNLIINRLFLFFKRNEKISFNKTVEPVSKIVSAELIIVAINAAINIPDKYGLKIFTISWGSTKAGFSIFGSNFFAPKAMIAIATPQIILNIPDKRAPCLATFSSRAESIFA